MKGQMKQVSDILDGLIIVGISIFILFIFIGYYVVMKTEVKSTEEERNAMNLVHVLISSDLITYSDDNTIYRGILDENKLNNIDSSKIFNQINYPSYKYFVKIENLDDGKSWIIGEKFNSNIIKTSPIAIKNGDDVQIGNISITFSRK